MKIRRPVFNSALAILTMLPVTAFAQSGLPAADALESPPATTKPVAVAEPTTPEIAVEADAEEVQDDGVAADDSETSARDERLVAAMLNLDGTVGLQHLAAAWGGEAGTYRIALLGQYSTGTDVIRFNDENTLFAGNLLFEASPIDYFSVNARLQTRSNVNTFGRPEAMLSQGDFSLGLKGYYPVADGVTLGGDLSFVMPTNFGATGLSFDGMSVRPRLLASFAFGEMQEGFDLNMHFNLGYKVDRSENTVPDGVVPTRIERFAYGISAYDALELGLGFEYELPYVTPFAAWNLSIPVNGADGVCDQANLPCAGDAGFASFPNVLALGVKVQPIENLGLHLGMDIGLTGDDAAALPATLPWQAVFGLQWTIDPRPKIEYVEKEVERAEPTLAPESYVMGIVTDRESALPIAGAIVHYPMGNETAQVTDEKGAFKSYGYAPGSTVRFSISHPDYEAIDVDRTLPQEVGEHELRVQMKASMVAGTVAGSIKDEKDAVIFGATLTMTGPESKTVEADATGNFNVSVKAGEYSASVSAPGYLTKARDVVVVAQKTTDLAFVLKPEPKESLAELKGDKIEIMQTVQFETGKATILSKSFSLLEQVTSVVAANPGIKQVLIGGHTDDVGSDDFNLELSQKRAESVRQFLIDQGISPSRLVAKGFGETQPLLPNTSSRNRSNNRRVEFKVTDR
jgi:outer membrane protein OmpA-like peptidoglycan-associated protein